MARSWFYRVAVSEALRRRRPEVFHTDQGSQVTSEAFTGKWKEHAIQISMDGRGRALDDVFTERLWRSAEYEEVHLKDYQKFPDAQRGLRAYFRHYNQERPHQALGYRTPAAVYGRAA